jgi:hypothetical protein
MQSEACGVDRKNVTFYSMSTGAQAILDQIRALPHAEVQAVWYELQRLVEKEPKTSDPADPIRSARGMFAGTSLTKALLMSRLEDKRGG